MKTVMMLGAAVGACLSLGTAAQGAIYLNKDLISVAVGAGTSPGTFNNTFTNSPGLTIEKVIDAPSADAEEFHDQDTHIWFTADQVGGGLELVFDFNQEYDISTLHFWNYNGEAYDVDQIKFTFFNGANAFVGELDVFPALGSPGGITAEDIVLAAPLNVRYVTAFLTGTNREVDFQNIGFTAEVSTPVGGIPEPSTWGLMILGFGALGGALRRRRSLSHYA
jgi:hypothetical protein